jgi:threonine dehydrogenase-like Zn-dependent dehydrogenase
MCESRETPRIVEPSDAIIRVSAACVCGSDLWPYRGIEPVDQPHRRGHEWMGIVEQVSANVTTDRNSGGSACRQGRLRGRPGWG